MSFQLVFSENGRVLVEGNLNALYRIDGDNPVQPLVGMEDRETDALAMHEALMFDFRFMGIQKRMIAPRGVMSARIGVVMMLWLICVDGQRWEAHCRGMVMMMRRRCPHGRLASMRSS